MKKTYYKPMINIESFEMDIDILASLTQADLDFFKWDFETSYADDLAGMTDAEKEALWNDYVLTNMAGYDNVSSGLCYHSTGGLS